MIPAIKEINFPEYATLSQATVNIADMGEKTITTQIKIDGSVVPDFSFDWVIEYEGERYIHSAREPQASKENTSMRTTVDLTFKHWAVVELQRYYFVEMASTESGTVIPDQYKASLGLALPDFVNALNKVLDYWYGDSIKAVLNPAWVSSSERTYIDINYSHVWDVLQKVYDYYGVRWTIEQYVDDTDDVTLEDGGFILLEQGWKITAEKTEWQKRCYIKFGFDATESSHIFEYGYKGGLLKVERQVQSTDIRNVLLGRGGDRNLPYLYFKDYAKYGNSANSDNGAFKPDPDAIPELKDIPFTQLRSAEFRSYVQGWAAKHYGGTVSMDQAYVPWAWEKGYTDSKFEPVDYVKDEESIKKYGQHWGGIDDNEDIYPSIQGSGLNDIVAVGEILSDNVDSADAEAESVTANVSGTTITYGTIAANADREITKRGIATFTVPAGMTGVLLPVGGPQPSAYKTNAVRVDNNRISEAVVVDWSYSVRSASGTEVNASNIAPGTYSVDVTVKVRNAYGETLYNVSAVIAGFSLVSSTKTETKGATFDVWLKNIWETSKMSGETDEQYAQRVWLPILGTADESAQLTFITGLLSVSSDYEFTIVGIPVYDTSKSHSGVQSHWRMTLGRSQAEYKATGKLIPNTKINAVPGDQFVFTGIELPHKYILWAEQRLHDYKMDNLLTTASIQPTWVVSVDKVRANNMEPGEVEKLSEQLKVGSLIRIADERITDGVPIELHVQSATYTWQEPSEGSPYIYPDIEVVLSDKVSVVSNPVAQLQGEVSALQQFIGGISNIQQIIKAVGDRLYLRKDGIADLSNSPTRFANVLTGSLFRQGSIGGRDWGFYRDDSGSAVLETDRIIVRQDMQVNSLIINQASYIGGMQINSAASIECIDVENTEKGDYKCYFDVKQGAVANLFKVDDVAFCQRWDADTTTLKFYKRRVIEVGEDYIVLSDTEKNGSGVPESKDNIIQYGNYTDKNRQDVIIRDVIGGGYERMLTGLDSVNSSGDEYYFAGRHPSTGPRWFVGNSDGEFAEYKDGRLNIKGSFLVYKEDGVYVSLQEYITNNDTEYLRKATNYGTLIDGGLVLTSLIQLGMPTDAGYMVYSGINGIMDESKNGKGIAAWYGGPMVDREADTDAKLYAESLFRFDGSGYLAGGSISWDERGNGRVGRDVNGNPVLSWDEKGVTLSDTIRIGTGDETLTTVLNFIAKMDRMFELDTTSVPGKTFIKAKYDGLYTDGFLSAIGLNPNSDTGGGASYLSDLYDVNKDSVLGAKRNDVLTWDGSKWVAQAASGGTVKSVRIGSSSNYTPDSSGVISLPAYPDLSWYYTKEQAESAISSAINSALTSVMKFNGVTTTAISDGSTTGTVIIDGASYTAKNGDVVLYGSKEFVWTGSAWEELGDEASWALKTVTITGTGYLTGGGSLVENRTIDIADTYKTYIQHGETAYGYFSGGVIGVSHLPSLYVGTTKIQSVSSAQALTGITNITMTGKLKIGDATIEWDEANSALKIDAGVYSEKFMSALGINGSSGSGGGSGVSYDRLDNWSDYNAGMAGYVLSAKLGYDLHTRLNTATGNIASLTERVSSLESSAGVDTSKYMTLDTDQNISAKKTWRRDISSGSTIPTGNTFVSMDSFGITFNFNSTGSAYNNTSVVLASKEAGTLSIGDDIIATRAWVESQGYSKGGSIDGPDVQSNIMTTDTEQSVSGTKTWFQTIPSGTTILQQKFISVGYDKITFSNDGRIVPGVPNTISLYTSENNVLTADGTFQAAIITQTSDERLKEIIRDVTLTIEQVASAPSVVFNWKDVKGTGVGSIAQYWKEILPEAVNEGEYLSMQYGNIALVSVISVARKVRDHEERIAALERENAKLRESNAELKKEVELLKTAS